MREGHLNEKNMMYDSKEIDKKEWGEVGLFKGNAVHVLAIVSTVIYSGKFRVNH